jgi:hypothetical protein
MLARSDRVFGKLVVFQAFVKGLREFLIGFTRPAHGT